jgi:hypothetical protein
MIYGNLYVILCSDCIQKHSWTRPFPSSLQVYSVIRHLPCPSKNKSSLLEYKLNVLIEFIVQETLSSLISRCLKFSCNWKKLQRRCNIFISYKVKAKVKSPCLTNYALCHEGVWASGCIDPLFLTSALVGGEWSASRPSCFTPGERAPGTHWMVGWVDPRVGLHYVRKFLTLPGLVQPIDSRYTDCAIPAPFFVVIQNQILWCVYVHLPCSNSFSCH